MKLQKIHLVRALGYVVLILVVLIYFKKDIVNVWSTSSWIYTFSPIWACCGVLLTKYKKKTFPLSRGENIFSIIFAIAVVAVLVLRIVFITQTA